MSDWSYTHLGALIGALVVFLVFIIGFEETLVVVLGGIVGYLIGMFLDGRLTLEDIRSRAQGRG